MRDTVYHEISCKTALHKLKRKIPYGWDLNLYRGCEHGCWYCYAMYAHPDNDNGSFDRDIYIKSNILEALEQDLKAVSWKKEIVNIGGVTDSYQQAETKYKLMPEVLRLLIKYETPAIISTKSDLILRDYDLIDKLSSITYVNIAATITCADETIRKTIEPGGADTKKRFQVLEVFRHTNASTGMHFMPIIPCLTDSYDNIDVLFHETARVKADYMLPGVLYLRGLTKPVFLAFIQREYPDKYEQLAALYVKGSADKVYKNRLYEMLNERKEFYGLTSAYSKVMKEKRKQTGYRQLSLFEED